MERIKISDGVGWCSEGGSVLISVGTPFVLNDGLRGVFQPLQRMLDYYLDCAAPVPVQMLSNSVFTAHSRSVRYIVYLTTIRTTKIIKITGFCYVTPFSFSGT